MFFHELLIPKNNSNLFSSDHTQFTSKNAYFKVFNQSDLYVAMTAQGPMDHGWPEPSGDDLYDIKER